MKYKSWKSNPRVVGQIYVYDNGSSLVKFVWDGQNRDGYAWSEKRQQRIAEWGTLRDLKRSLEASSNHDGAYGCAQFDL
jgi:hypothetical protein